MLTKSMRTCISIASVSAVLASACDRALSTGTDQQTEHIKSITVRAPNEIRVGQSVVLNAFVMSDTYRYVSVPVQWTSSDESVAIVEDGRLLGLKPGKATITASAGDKF